MTSLTSDPGQGTDRSTPAARLPCIHRGQMLQREASTLQAAEVHSCALFGECVVSARERRVLRRHGCKLKACATCRQRCASESDRRVQLSAEDLPACDVVIPYDPVNLKWLVASVESILNQTGVACLVHLVADGFEDPNDPALRFLGDPQVRLYRNESVIGPYRTMNRLFDRLESPYIAVQDSDDIALPHRLRFSIDALQQHDAEIFGAAMRQFVSYDARDAEVTRRVQVTPVHTSGHRNWKLCPDGNIINGTLVLCRETFGRLNGFAPLMGSADMEFATRAHRAGCRIVTAPEVVGLRRLHSGSLSQGRMHGVGTPSRAAVHAWIEQSYRRMVPGSDFRRFGGLASERYERHRTNPLNRDASSSKETSIGANGRRSSLIPLHNLEIHVSHACNLSCEQCTHYSNYHHKGMLSPEEADRQMGLWSGRLLPRHFSLLGGEPTLNPKLTEICRIARRHWPHSRIQLVTNGFLLGRHPELPELLEETGTHLEISVHHDSPEYRQRLNPVRELVAEWESRYTLRVNWRPSSTRWRRTYRGDGPAMLPYDDGAPRRSWQVCTSKWCPQIHEGKLWKCPQVAYLPMQAEKFNLHQVKQWRPYLNYTPLDPACSDDQLREFVNRKVEPCCAMCPAKPESFRLPSPLVNLTPLSKHRCRTS